MDLKTYLSERRGRASALAVSLGVTPVTVHQWAKGKPVPAERCPAIERVTDGVVTCEELRPDLAESWAYLRGSAAKKEDSAPPPSRPSPLHRSGQGANSVCQESVPASIAADVIGVHTSSVDDIAVGPKTGTEMAAA